jgi:phosphoribosylanthranilate isomerase
MALFAAGAPVRVKFCGLTREVDVDAACALGVDAIGLNLARGPRRIGLDRAAALAQRCPATVTVVLLFVDADEAAIRAACAATGAGTVQLHGAEPADLARRLRPDCRVIKACAGSEGLARLSGYPADAVLVDAPASSGGRGEPWDWSTLASLNAAAPLMLAGGLDPSRVAAAVRAVRPWAVDVASGIESAPGVKDPARMADFLAAVRAAG